MSALLIPVQVVGLSFSLFMYMRVATKTIDGSMRGGAGAAYLWAFITVAWAILLAVTVKEAP